MQVDRRPGVADAILAALPELVFVLDRDGVYVDVLGGRDDTRYHDGHALIGQRLHDVLPSDRADEFLDRIREALDTDSVVRHDYRLSVHDVDGVDPDDGVPDDLWFEGRAAPVAAVPGRDDLVVWLAFNVTASRRAARELEAQKGQLEQQAAELAELSHARQRLLSAVSHDLRGPLTSIRGFLELLDERREQLEGEQVRELLGRGRARAAQMEHMIADLLGASRPEQVLPSSEPAAVSVAATVRSVLGDGQGDDAVLADVEDALVYADPSHLERIVVNLLDNARKYGAPPVEVSVRPDGPRVHIEVRDHGDGVPPAFAPKLFAAFTQAAGQNTTADGIGLGLSIVQQLASANGGMVAYDALPDGACFVVTLPAVPPDAD